MKKILKGLLLVIALVLSITFITGCTAEPETSTVGLGETFTFDDLEITLGTEISFTKIENEFSEDNGKDVVKLPVTVKNIKDETHSLNMFYYKVFGATGTEANNAFAYFEDSVDEAGEIRSGGSYTKYMYFVYDGDGKYAIEFDNWIDKVTIEFEVKK